MAERVYAEFSAAVCLRVSRRTLRQDGRRARRPNSYPSWRASRSTPSPCSTGSKRSRQGWTRWGRG